MQPFRNKNILLLTVLEDKTKVGKLDYWWDLLTIGLQWQKKKIRMQNKEKREHFHNAEEYHVEHVYFRI